MLPKQNNIDSTLIVDKESEQISEASQTTGIETKYGFTKARAIVVLASIVIGGVVIYEKLSQKPNQPSLDIDNPPVEQSVEQSPPATPTTSNEKPNSENNNSTDTNNSKPEKHDKKESNSKEKHNKEISINNYDEFIPNLPADRRDSLNISLYKNVVVNSKSENLDITDATIRDGSVKYDYNKSKNINSGSFIVDMPSIKQSYMLTYQWSSDKYNINLGGYAGTVTCLPPDRLIYGNFNCVDDFEHSKIKAERDPILDKLRHSTFNYSITADNDSGKIGLNIEIFLFLADTRDGGRDDSIEQYKSDAINWIKSQKLNPDDYTIKYIIKG